MKCRHCNHQLTIEVADLGASPPSNDYLNKNQLNQRESYYPLNVWVCEQCWLVQTQDFNDAGELFDSNYAYFSSTSTSWLAHAELYVEQITNRLELNKHSFVIEIASNDGYLLKNFKRQSIPCLGIEPTSSTALAAEKLGIDVIQEFFGVKLSKKISDSYGKADLIIGNNVYAHVPDINDFTAGLKNLLSEKGTISLEFPHLLNLLKLLQFDTIYHEHYSYLSLLSAHKILQKNNLRVYDVDELSTHGGSLRLYICHIENTEIATKRSVSEMLDREQAAGLDKLTIYQDFMFKTLRKKHELLQFFLEQKQKGKRVAAYGAAAKGNTMINFIGIRSDLLEYVCDKATSKQNMYLPGSHIPIYHPDKLKEEKPDVIVILPWNISYEIVKDLEYTRSWGAELITLMPQICHL